MEATKALPADDAPTTRDETLPHVDTLKTISDDRKPLKKRRVLIPALYAKEADDPQPIELVRQVATYWENTSRSTERDDSWNVGTTTTDGSTHPRPYYYEDYCSKGRAKGEDCHQVSQMASTFRSVDVASRRVPTSNADTSIFSPIPQIVELKKPPRRFDEEEEEDLEKELNCLTLLCQDTAPKQHDRQSNAITPSPTPYFHVDTSGRVAHLFDKSSFELDPIPWTSEPSCAGLIDSTFELLLAMDLDTLDDSCKGSNNVETPTNTPTKREKRVRFDPAANTTITITPRKSKQTIPVASRRKTRIDDARMRKSAVPTESS